MIERTGLTLEQLDLIYYNTNDLIFLIDVLSPGNYRCLNRGHCST